VDNLIVTRNGVVLEDGTDYTATDGSTITLAVAAAAGDEINVVAFKSFTTADMVSATNGGTFQGNVDFAAGIDVTGNVTVTGTVDGRDVATDGTKLDGIEASADVTDTANVAAAGAAMLTGANFTGNVDVTGTVTADYLDITAADNAITSKIANTTGANYLQITNGTANGYFGTTGANTVSVLSIGTHPITFGTDGGVERLRIGSTGIIYVNGDGTGGRISGDGSGGLVLQDGNGRQSFVIDSPASGSTQAMTLDASGNLLVGKESSSFNVEGQQLNADGTTYLTKDSGHPLYLNRTTSEGDLAAFYKDGSTVGSIGVGNGSRLFIGSGDTGIMFDASNNAIYPWDTSTNNLPASDQVDLGYNTTGVRFKDIYISNRLTNSGSGGVRIDTNNHAYIRKKGTHQYEFDCGAFTAGQGKKIFTTNAWTAGGGSITVFQNAGFFGVGQFSFILHYGGCAFTLQHGTTNYATFSVNLNTPSSGQTEVFLTMGYAMTDVKIFLNFDGYPYVGAGSLVNSVGSGITMTEVSHHTLA